MSEFPYRAKRLSGEWMEGYLCGYVNDGKIPCISNPETGVGAGFWCQPGTACRNTYLTYRDGSTVWEGDRNEHGVVVWLDGSFRLDGELEGQKPTPIQQDRTSRWTRLGSIHDGEGK